MGMVLPFVPKSRKATEIKNVVLIDKPIIDRDAEYAMGDDTAPFETNPDPVIEDI